MITTEQKYNAGTEHLCRLLDKCWPSQTSTGHLTIWNFELVNFCADEQPSTTDRQLVISLN